MKHKSSNLGRKVGIALFSMALCVCANAQDRKVSGQILDENGEPIIGASVKVQNTQIGSITDFDGKFTINVPEGKKITVSYIGYLGQTITPEGDNLRIVLLEDTQSLDEVVVVGYGTMKQKNITGSITAISAEELEDLPVSTLAEALEGEINGLTIDLASSRPGDGLNNQLYIRSARTMNGLSKDGGNANPLIIIDDVIQLTESGAPSMEQFNMLDPSEVESITVLRDASAAIYGSRAANGAILIKTKRGKDGVPRISYSGKFAVNDAISHSKVLKGSDYGRFYNAFMIGSGQNRTSSNALFSEDEIAELDNINYDWLDKANWKAAFQQTHTLNVSGGSDRATYYAGASYLSQGANLGGQDYKRFTFRAGVDIQLTTDVKLSASLSGNEGESNSIYTKGARFNMYGMGNSSEKADYNVLHHMPNFIPWSVQMENESGEMEEVWMGPYTSFDRNPQWNRSSASSWNYFALRENGSYSNQERNNWTANISLTYNVPYVKGLSIRATYATSHSTDNGEQAAFPYQLAFMSKQFKADQHLASRIPAENYQMKDFTWNTQLYYTDNISKSQQMNLYVTYDRTFGKHTVGAMFSIERYESEYTSKQMTYENLPMDMKDIYKGNADKSLYNYLTDNSVTGRGESGSLSYLGRINYSYADKYLFQFLFRTDASVKFAPENYWGFFPGLSAGWVMSEENWFKDRMPWFEFLKVRFSWGRTGRDNIKYWQWKEVFDVKQGSQFGELGGQRGSGLQPGVTPNRNIKWDTTDKFDLGFDMHFLGGRLSTTIDVYYDMNDNILNNSLSQQPGIPIYAGGSYAQENFGRIDTYGVEVSVGWRDRIGDFSYNVGVDFGWNDDRVREWVPGLRDNQYPSSTEKAEGMSTIFPTWGFKVWKGTSTGDGILRTQADIDAYWAYLSANAAAAGTTPQYLGITEKKNMVLGSLAYQDLGGEMENGKQLGPNGRIAKEQDYARLNKRNDSHSFTTKLGASWKGISIRANIATSWGGVRFIDREDIKTGNGSMIWSPDSFWRDMYDEVNNPMGRYPNLGVDRKIGGSVIADSDFWSINTFRCYIRNLTIAYTLPKKWITPLKMQSVRFNLTGNNLWDFYNPYPDHYRNMYDDGAVNYPTLRTWSLGVNVTF